MNHFEAIVECFCVEECPVYKNWCLDHVDLPEIEGVFYPPFIGFDSVIWALENPECFQGAVTHGSPVFHDFSVYVFRVGQAGTVIIFPVLIGNGIAGLVVSMGQFLFEVS